MAVEHNSPETTVATPQDSPPVERGGVGRNFRNEGRSGRGSGGRRRDFNEERTDGLSEKTIFINRSSKVVKGGRRFSFSALIVAGDKQGRVGIGLGKGGEVSEAIRKGGEKAKLQLKSVSLNGNTIPHEILCEYGGANVLLKPASPGTGLICGKTVRAVVESVGVKDILSKSLGSKNPANVAKATLKGLLALKNHAEIFKARGL